MMRLKAIAALALSVLLTGCFLTPGTFDSSLDVKRDGSFAFAYKGEVVFAVPDEAMRGGKTEAWSDDKAVCDTTATPDESAVSDGITDATGAEPKRGCTPAQIVEQKRQWEQTRAASAKNQTEEARKFAQLFGYTPGDDEANRKLAAQMARFDGFRSVTYAGNGVFNVDYAKSGQLGHDFVFPTLLQGNALFPFVIARRQTDGAVRVAAPAFAGKGGLGMFEELGRMGGGSAKAGLPPTRIKGRFTLTTDGEVLTNNTQDGPAAIAGGKRLMWDVDQRTTAAPEALIKLK